MKKAAFMITLIALLVLITFNSYGEEQKAYKSPYFNFTVNYPSDWQTKGISGMVVFLSPLESGEDRFSENVNVVVEDISNNPMTLNDYQAASLTNASRVIPDFKLLEEGESVIDGKDAFSIIFTAKSSAGGVSKCKQYVFISDSKAYILTYSALEEDFGKYLSQAESIMKSIRITK